MAEEQRQRLIFMGTPIFAAMILEKLIAADAFDIVAVFCGPDRRVGRGHKIEMCETGKMALANNLRLFQPATLKDEETVRQIEELKPDCIVVAAYGKLIPQRILDIPEKGAINVHASLLPAYRGAAPMQRAIMENWSADAKTGVSIMKMVQELDAGPVYAQKGTPIGRHDRLSLERELAALGGDLLVETLLRMRNDNVPAVPQNEELVTWAPKLEKTDGIVDWNKTVAEVDALIRAVTPWPGAQASFVLTGRKESLPVILMPGEPGDKESGLQAGEIFRQKGGLRIACSDGWYIPGAIRPQGQREMSGADFANGYCKVKSGHCGQAINIK